MAHPKHRISQTRQAKRRTHKKLEVPNVSTCPTTGQPHIFHRALWHEGKMYYKGKVVIDSQDESKG